MSFRFNTYKHNGHLTEWCQDSNNARRRFEERMLDNLAQDRVNGMSYDELEEKYDLNKRVIQNYIRRHRPYAIYNYDAVPDGFITTKEYCSKYSITRQTLEHYFKKDYLTKIKHQGLVFCENKKVETKQKNMTWEQRDLMLRMYELGVPKTKIAKKLGFSTITIQRNLKDLLNV